MLAAVFHGPRDIRLAQVAAPEPQAGEVLIKVRAGICGSDMNRFHYGSHPGLLALLWGMSSQWRDCRASVRKSPPGKLDNRW